MHEPELRMQMVEIEMLALAAFQPELQLFSLVVAAKEIRPTGLYASKDAHQPFLEFVLFDELPGQGLLSRVAGTQIFKWTLG